MKWQMFERQYCRQDLFQNQFQLKSTSYLYNPLEMHVSACYLYQSWELDFAHFFLYTVYKVRDKTLIWWLKNSLGIHLD